MASVWKRLQRVNKRAAKFQFTASYHELHLETTAKWRPSNLSVVWTRRSRRVVSAPLPWEPDMVNPLVGKITWPVPDNHAISVTLFKDPRTHELEDKDWTFVLEDITHLGKKRVLASASINMRKYASIESTQQSFTISLKPSSRKISNAELELTISCVFLREGKATDEDMQSVVSMMSVNNNCDVAPLDDLEDIPDLESSGDISDHLYDFTQQLEQMTSSLNGCMDLPTPLSDKEFNSGGEDSLKTPSAAQQILHSFSRQQIVGDAMKSPLSPISVGKSTNSESAKSDERYQPREKEKTNLDTILTVITTTAAAAAAVTATTNTTSKIVTSTPIANKAEEKLSAELEVKIRSLNFGGNDSHETTLVETSKQNGNMYKLKEPTNDTTKLYTEKSTITVKKEVVNATESNIPSPAAATTITTTTTSSEMKRAELQPLNLKKNYEHEEGSHKTNNTIIPNGNTSQISTFNKSISSSEKSIRPVEKIILKENTPGQDLLEWCKDVTKDYPNVKVTNLTTSWRNGMAFCAIIHHFEPDLIDMSKLSAHDVIGNCRIAFDTAESLGIPRVIEPRDMSMLNVPDKLAVMTYLHQLRAHFTGKQLQIEQIGPTSDESSYVIGNYKSDNLSQNLLNLSHLKVASLLHQNSLDDDIYGLDNQQRSSSQLSPTAKKDVKNLILSGSKSILGKVLLSPAKDKNTINADQHGNNQTAPSSGVDGSDPYGLEIGDGGGEENTLSHKNGAQMTSTPVGLDPKTANRILSRHKEMSEKAKMMIEKLKISNGERNEHDDERQQRLREQARRMILETRTKSGNVGSGSGSSNDSPNTPTKNKRYNFSPERTISPIHNGSIEDYGAIVSGDSDSGSPKMLSNSPSIKKITPPRDIDSTTSPSHRLSTERFNGSNNSPLQSFNAVMERISPKTDKRGDKLSYIESELEALEREQEAIDQKASSLEKKLRAVMGGNPKSEETEEQLLSQWFTLVNKKNALLRRQMQLNILEQESDLERKYTMLQQELRAAQSVEDWRKTEAQREKERLLLEELVAIVDKRDQLVQHLHNQEIAIEDDHEIARELEQVDISGAKDKCVIQ